MTCSGGLTASPRSAAIRSTNRPNSGLASCGPAAASGWNWTLNAGASVSRSPSTTWSLRPTWLTSTGPNGVSTGRSSGASTAKPWLWLVTRTVPLTRSSTGWFRPRWPKRSL